LLQFVVAPFGILHQSEHLVSVALHLVLVDAWEGR
jgi:hypothetical protein